MSQSALSPHHRYHHPPMAGLRPCLKPATPSPVASMPSSPCSTPGLHQRVVHFPAPANLHRVHPAHSGLEYDRTPIAPPSESERACAMPARGCPGKTYESAAIDGRFVRPSASALQGAPPPLTFSGSSSEESDEAYSYMHEHDPVPAYTFSASPRPLEMQFLPHAPSKRRSNSPARTEEDRRKELPKKRVACKAPGAQWCEWNADDDGGCLGGF
ncbi:hypothetical protein DACRYDRAFT_25638 [Dacryopinax primogenitus]|uniref:Uncharacterized protein n=1 Tax=Dacryopinax primogenitus (strain DJM 731) TaxID=1858805 RepID=M5FNT7_DACPD|nr:uncharacterized protein DACRYDRAFT_25638 [Dacryopinax primogenitus]EJT96553.1 hypothetical protein DACRYDRAFT_25638 [Dacryopinax primogenitus]